MLTIIVGLPRSGKSTMAREIATKKQNESLMAGISHNIVIVEVDKIRQAIYGQRYNSYVEDHVQVHKLITVKTLLSSDYDVIIDDTHTRWESIIPLLRIEPDAEIIHRATIVDYFVVTMWDKHVFLCKNRAIDTGQSDLIPVIDRMANNLQLMINNDYADRLAREREKAKQFIKGHRIV